MSKPTNRVMVIGAVGAGKSTLIKALFNEDGPAMKTQSLHYRDWVIDTPGEYSENPLYYRSLMATSYEAKLILMVQDATKKRSYFPPGFSQGFPIPAIGVVTKIDHPDADLAAAQIFLKTSLYGGDIWLVSAKTRQGIEALRYKLQSMLGGKMEP